MLTRPRSFTVALAQPEPRALMQNIALLPVAVTATLKERQFTLECWVVLPDQQFCIWTLPKGDCDFPTRWWFITSRFARSPPVSPLRLSYIRRSKRDIWQGRYWENHIGKWHDMVDHLRYCQLGPVGQGWLRDPEAWPDAHFVQGACLPARLVALCFSCSRARTTR